MPAPRRKAPRRNGPSPSGILAQSIDSKASGAIFTNSTPAEQPMIVRNPGSVIDDSSRTLMKFSQLIMMCIALAAIWGGLFSIAFAEDATNSDFLILFLGGFLSAGIAIGWIYAQSKKNDFVLYEVQDYMLGIGFFFATIGAVWGSRWLIGFVTGEGITDLFGSQSEFLAKGWTDSSTDEWVEWHPNAKAIYVQTAALLLLVFGEVQLLKRFKGATGFGRAVAAYAPILVLVAAGIGPWMKWTNNVISYEIGISLVLLCLVSMEMALRSNKALNFVVVAVVSGLTPILFELYNTNAEVGGEGGALSLLVFIIAIQGYYAARQELRSDLIQKASIVLVGEIVFAMFIARIANLNLHLGPIKSTELGIDHLFGLGVALWVSVLAFYFPAVQQRRVPWMPIGLAAALVVLPNDGSAIPWAISLLMVPYMLFIAKATRRWVADYTFTTLAIAYFITDLIANLEGISLSETFGIRGMQVVIPISLFVTSEYARRNDKISPWTHLVMLAAIVLSRAIIQADDWFMPWIFIAYMLYLARNSFVNLTTSSPWNEKLQATFIVIIANASMILLALLDRINVPEFLQDAPLPEHFNYQIFILGAASYLLLYNSRNIELDTGLMVNWTKRFVTKAPTFDPETNTWSTAKRDTDQVLADWAESNSWSQLTRVSLMLPFFMMSFSLVTMSDPWGGFDSEGSESLIKFPWILLLLLPVYGLVHEIKNMEVISSVVRSAGVWVLFTIALPLSLSFNIIRDEMLEMSKYEDTALLPVPILLDVILLSAPLYVNWLIAKRGIDKEHLSVGADAWAMVGLIALACLDTSGGLLLITMLALVTVRSVQHRHVWPLMISPFAFVLLTDSWLEFAGVARTLLEASDAFSYNFADNGFAGIPRIGGLLIALQMLYVILMDNRYVKASQTEREPIPWYGPWSWALIGVLAATSSIGWIPTLLFMFFIVNSWLSGNISPLIILHIGLLVSLIIGMRYEDVDLEFSQAFSWSAILTACSALTFTNMGTKGVLFKNVPESKMEYYTEEKQKGMVNELYIFTYTMFILGYDAFLGLGTLFGAVLLTRDILTKGYSNALLLAPVVHALALANLLNQLNVGVIPEGSLIGIFLIIEGLFISWLSLQNDKVYDSEYFEWYSDDEFLDFIDRLGLAGVFTTLAGILILFSDIDQTSIGWLLTTVVLIAIGIQGYAPEHEARWRRILGGYGSIFSFIAFSSEIESDTMQSLSWIGVGLIALGWGFLMMQRLDDDEGVFEEAIVEQENTAVSEPLEPRITIPEPVLEEDDVEGVTTDEDEEEIKSEPVVEEKVKERPQPQKMPVNANIETSHGFEIRLPPGKLEAIIKSIDSTPHDGYKPVIGLHENGKIVIDWVAL